jgi:hypothetical protein
MPAKQKGFIEKLPPFLPGLDLNRQFFQQVVKPLMDQHFPGLRYSAGLVGEGSDVLRFDTPQSMDHNWGPHVRIFLSEADFQTKQARIDRMLRNHLPVTFLGFPTNFTKKDEQTYLVQQMSFVKEPPVNHMIQFFTVRSFFEHYLGINPYKRLNYKDWLTFPQQALIEATGGEVYYDGLGELEKIREKFRYFPDDVWHYMYEIQWEKIMNVEAYMGRTGQVGDELGSSLITADIVTNIVKMCFMIEKRYIPYAKWMGTAFSRLKCAPEFTHRLVSVLHGHTWQEREEKLGEVYEILAKLHNNLRIGKPLDPEVSDYHGRPFKVIHAWKVARQLVKTMRSKSLKNLHYKLGSVDQFIDHARINHMNYIYRKLRNIIR